MLVLTRFPGESIKIGDHIWLSVLKNGPQMILLVENKGHFKRFHFKEGAMLMIDDLVSCACLSFKIKNQVRLGFSAPKNINIVRSELIERPKRKNM